MRDRKRVVAILLCQVLTIVGVPDAVLEDGVPFLLVFLCHCAEVVVAGVGVPENQRELCGTLQKWRAARFSLDT